MNIFHNLDLLAVGVTVAATLILGTIIFLNDAKSVTNRSFFGFTIMASAWGVSNYLNYNIASHTFGLWILRTVIFFALWQALFLFEFFLVYPKPLVTFLKIFNWFLVPLTFFTSILTLSPFVFSSVKEFSRDGRVLLVNNGPALPLFGMLSVGLIVVGIIVLLYKIIKIKEKQLRSSLFLVLWGTVVTFSLIIFFNFIFPTLFGNSGYIIYGSLFYIPFIVLTAYSIFRRGLLNTKIIATEILVFILAISVLLEVASSTDALTIMYKSSTFILVLIVGLFLIKSVRKEVEQRQHLEIITNELQTANTRLKELDQQKTDFLSIAAHQLRTPMSVMNGYIELIEDNAYGKVTKETKTILDNMDQSNQHLIKLVDEFLDITRIEQGRTKFDIADCDVIPLLTSVVEELGVRAKEHGLKINWRAPKEALVVAMDDEKIRHVAYNFVDNAIKYSDSGTITVSVLEGASEPSTVPSYYSSAPSAAEKGNMPGIIVKVKDEGLGFGKTDEANFFQKFYRGSNVKHINVNGTGLGLFVCRKFIEAHGGHIWAHSAGLGRGSEFGFWIPKKQL